MAVLCHSTVIIPLSMGFLPVLWEPFICIPFHEKTIKASLPSILTPWVDANRQPTGKAGNEINVDLRKGLVPLVSTCPLVRGAFPDLSH